MSEQDTQTLPPKRGTGTTWEIGKALNAFFPAREGEEEATETEEQDLDAAAVPGEGKAEADEEVQQEASEGEDAEPEGEVASSEPFLTLTVDGEQVEIATREEVIPLAQMGMHYTQEMQKLRTAQQEWAGERERMGTAMREKEGQYTAALQALNDTYGFVLGKEAPDWSSTELQTLKQEKPDEYMAMREQWDQLNAIRSELGRISREQQEKQQEQWQGWVTQQQKELSAQKPEWSDAARRQQDWGLIRDYAVSRGITEQEISNLYDHRFWIILHDAARFRQAEATGRTKRATPKSKTAKPGTGSNLNQGDRKLRSARERLKETGDPRAAGELFQDMMTRQKRG